MYTPLGHVQAGSADNNSVTTPTFDSTGADLFVALVSEFGSGTRAPMTDSKGNTWVGLTSRGSGQARATLWYCRPTTVGTGHTFGATATGTFPSIIVAAFSGSTPTPFDLENGSVGSSVSTLAPGSITPSLANELVVTALAANGDGAAVATLTGGFTVYGNVLATAHAESGVLAYLIQTTAVAANPTWTNPISSNLAAAIASFKVGAAVVSGGQMFDVF